MDLAEAIKSVDMDEIIDRLNAYALSRLKSVGLKNFNGRQPIDLVGDLILKVMEGTRDWSKAKCSFKEFLFGCLKSEIDNYFTTNTVNHTNELPDFPVDESANDIEVKKKLASDLLRQEGADKDELTVFECWMDGITKPSEIAIDLEVDVKEIYKIIKRLERKRPKIQKQATHII